MNILCLILAQVITGSAFTQPDPYGYRTDFYIKMPARDPILDYTSRINESNEIGRAVQTGQVYDPFSGRTMIRTSAPQSPYYNMSREQASQIRDIETGQLANEVNIRGAELKQKQDALEYKYKLNEIDQSEKIYDEINALDPRSPDYLSTRSALFNKYPIAAQNPKVQNSIGLIDRTHSAITENNAVLNRQQQLAKDAEREKDINSGRTWAGQKYGARGVAAYEELLAKDPTNPVGAMASMMDAQEQESRLSQLKEIGLDDNRIGQFYTPEVGPGGQPTGRKILDSRRVDSFIKTYPTASQAATSANALQKIMESQAGVAPEDWDPSVKAAYDFHGQQLQRYQSLTGQKQEVKPTKKKSVDDFF